MDTLVSLAGQFPLLGPVRDLHPLADIHASQTKFHTFVIVEWQMCGVIPSPTLVVNLAKTEFLSVPLYFSRKDGLY